jgi:hypothetical protein
MRRRSRHWFLAALVAALSAAAEVGATVAVAVSAVGGASTIGVVVRRAGRRLGSCSPH